MALRKLFTVLSFLIDMFGNMTYFSVFLVIWDFVAIFRNAFSCKRLHLFTFVSTCMHIN